MTCEIVRRQSFIPRSKNSDKILQSLFKTHVVQDKVMPSSSLVITEEKFFKLANT